MIIRKAKSTDAEDLKVLYFEYLTAYPPTEEQDMDVWANLLDKFERDENMYLLVVEENEKVVSSVQMAIIESLTHNIRPFAVIENVVTHIDYRNKGYASALLDKASEIAKERRCYKVFLETGSNKESTLNFYRNNGFEIDKNKIEKRISMDNILEINSPSTFVFKVSGNSMCEIGIYDEDYVIIKKTPNANIGDVVLAIVDNEFTLKTYKRDNLGAYLKPENSSYPVIRPVNSLTIFGVAVGITRKF